MTLLLIGIGVVALTLPGARPSLSLRGDPRWFVQLDTAALILGVGACATGLGLSVIVGALHLGSGSSLLRYEGHVAPGGFAASSASAAILLLSSARFVRAARRVRRHRRAARADMWLGQRHDRGDHQLIVLPTSTPIAYSIDGHPPQVVISRGLQNRLGTEFIDFVIEHERSHLRRRHRHALLLATGIEAVLPWAPVRRSTLALRLAIERTADEDAAGRDAVHRRRVAAAMRRLGSVSWAPLGGSDSANYRARQLGTPMHPRRLRIELAATAGLAALALVATGVLGHATSDLPLLATRLG